MDNDQEEGQTEEASKTEEKSTEEDKQETSETKQSNEADETKGEKLYKDSFTGKDLTADEMYETYKSSQGHTTRVEQELADLKKSQQASEEQAEDSIRENKLLKNVPPDVKEAIISIVKPMMEQENQRRDAEQTQVDKDKAFKTEMGSLAKELDGKDGMPKFDESKTMKAMVKPGNRIYDPRAMHFHLNRKEINDILIKKALKQQRGGRQPETTGKSGSEKPTGKTPKSFAEASRAMLSRMQSE